MKNLIYITICSLFILSSCDDKEDNLHPNISNAESVEKHLENKLEFMDIYSETALDVDKDGEAHNFLVHDELLNYAECISLNLQIIGSNYILEPSNTLSCRDAIGETKEIGDFQFQGAFWKFEHDLHLILQHLNLKKVNAITVYKSIDLGITLSVLATDQQDEEQYYKLLFKDKTIETGLLTGEDLRAEMIE